MDKKFVITVGRQYGSGGREIGKLLSEMFGIGYYDRELMMEAARRSGLCEEFFEKNDEKVPGSLMHVLTTAFSFNPGFSEDSLFKFQSDAIRSLAEQGSCVIVGRSADYILRENPYCYNIFIHAPEEVRIRNIMQREGLSEKAAADRMERINKTRAAYYNFYTDKQWGESASYHLSIDSSVLGIQRSAEYIRDFVQEALKK